MKRDDLAESSMVLQVLHPLRSAGRCGRTRRPAAGAEQQVRGYAGHVDRQVRQATYQLITR